MEQVAGDLKCLKVGAGGQWSEVDALKKRAGIGRYSECLEASAGRQGCEVDSVEMIVAEVEFPEVGTLGERSEVNGTGPLIREVDGRSIGLYCDELLRLVASSLTDTDPNLPLCIRIASVRHAHISTSPHPEDEG